MSALNPVPVTQASGQQTTTATSITVTLPTYTVGDYILLILTRNNTDASVFTYSAAVTSATEIANAGTRAITAVQITPNGAGQTSFTVTGTSSLWTWWIADYGAASTSLTVNTGTDAIGNTTNAVIAMPEVQLGYIATGNELLISAATTNSTATWTTDANTQFHTTANSSTLMVDAVNPAAGILTGLPATMNRGLSGTSRNQNSIALALQATPGGTVNLLSNPSFESGSTLATGWTDEHTTASEATYSLVGTGVTDGTLAQNFAYTGVAGDNGSAKTEIYQAPVDISPGNYLTFSIWLSGSLTNTYVDIGIESFTSGSVFISENDTYTSVLTGTPVQYQVSYLCPSNSSYVAAYVSCQEIGSTSSLSVTMDQAELTTGPAPSSGLVMLAGTP